MRHSTGNEFRKYNVPEQCASHAKLCFLSLRRRANNGTHSCKFIAFNCASDMQTSTPQIYGFPAAGNFLARITYCYVGTSWQRGPQVRNLVQENGAAVIDRRNVLSTFLKVTLVLFL